MIKVSGYATARDEPANISQETRIKYLPIHRARRLNTDEWYEGFFSYKTLRVNGELKEVPFLSTQINISGWVDGVQNQNNWDKREFEIDINTLSIHFSHLIDKNKRKMFASLNPEGLGGDLLTSIGYESNMYEHVLCFNPEEGFLNVIFLPYDIKGYNLLKVEVVGMKGLEE